jgi:hypothetical protein
VVPGPVRLLAELHHVGQVIASLGLDVLREDRSSLGGLTAGLADLHLREACLDGVGFLRVAQQLVKYVKLARALQLVAKYSVREVCRFVLPYLLAGGLQRLHHLLLPLPLHPEPLLPVLIFLLQPVVDDAPRLLYL